MREIEIYTDGSFNSATQSCTGGFVVLENNNVLICAKVDLQTPKYKESWNVSGELMTAITALNITTGLLDGQETLIRLYHDYVGVANYVTGAKPWQAKKFVSQLYVAGFRDFKKKFPAVTVQFHKVKAHTGNYWNEIVDRIANGIVPSVCEATMLPTITL